MTSSREFLLRLAGADAVAPALRLVGRGMLSIFMLHRFTDPALGVVGTDPAVLREQLAYLRRHRYRVLGMRDVLAGFADDADAVEGPAVAFTVDDGYADFVRVAAPIFAEYECPVTVFVTTGFLDAKLWLWWDRVAHLFQQTQRFSLALSFGSENRTYRWRARGERGGVQHDVIQRLEWLDAPARETAIAALARQLDVEPPAAPPPASAPMSWDDVRAGAARGITFGPHTVTHRILSQAPLEMCEWEIRESYRRLCEETDAVVPVLCFPNGSERSFGEREIAATQRAGLEGAVTAVGGYATPTARFTLPRFAWPADRPHLVHIVAGLARLTRRLRARRGA